MTIKKEVRLLKEKENIPFGKKYELEKFGECLWRAESHIDFFDCVQVIINTTRRLRFSDDYHTNFVKKLVFLTRKIIKSNKNDIHFFSAVNSPFDFFHGVDGFLVWWKNKEHTKGKIITIDITSKLTKEEFKADILIAREDILKEKAEEIALLFKENCQRKIGEKKPKMFFQKY